MPTLSKNSKERERDRERESKRKRELSMTYHSLTVNLYDQVNSASLNLQSPSSNLNLIIYSSFFTIEMNNKKFLVLMFEIEEGYWKKGVTEF